MELQYWVLDVLTPVSNLSSPFYFILFFCSNIEDMAREAISLDVEEETLDSELIPSHICFASFLSFFLVT